MSQLTSIAALRNSSAMQSRVTTVENFLKRLNRDWQAAWWFPIAFINVSNDDADMSWVRSHTSTHLKPGGSLKLGASTASVEAVIESLKGLRLETEADLPKIDEALSKAFGTPVAWINGLVPTEVAAAQAPFAQTGTQLQGSVPSSAATPTTAVAKKVARKSSTVKPIATKPSSSKPTKLDEVKRLFNDLTPKQKVELAAFAEQKILASKPCLAEREKLNTTPASA